MACLAAVAALTAAPVPAQSIFVQESYLTSNSGYGLPNNAELVDLDGDGCLEALVANTTGGFCVLRGLGPKGFGPMSLYPMPDYQYGIASGDLDNDGVVDVAVAGSGFGTSSPGQLSILLGLGGGALSTPVIWGLESNAYDVKIADLDLDGNRDVVVPFVAAAKVNVRLGDGTGAFLAITSHASDPSPFRVDIADMNQDGFPDVLTASTASKVAIQLNDGFGGLSAPISYTMIGKCYSVATGDFNLDGQLDVAASNYVLGPPNAVSVFSGNGDGTLGSPSNLAGPRNTNLLTVRDFNLDGKADILALGYSYHIHNVYLGDGQGGFPQVTQFYTRRHTGGDVGDMNLDGLLDLAAPDYFGDVLRTRLGKPQGDFGEDIPDTGATTLTLADVNQDGSLDAVVGHNLNGALSLRAGNGAGAFAPGYAAFALGTGSLTRVRSADLDSNGTPDLVVVSPGGSVWYGTNSGTGAFTPFQALPNTSDPRAAAIGDVNLDGRPDIVVANYGYNTISIHRADAFGGFAAPSHILSGGSGTLDVELRDLNNDGDPELIVVNELSQVVGVALGQHHATFGPFNNYSCTPGLTVTVAVEDLDHDGFADVVTSNDSFGNVIVRVNDGQAQFFNAANVATAGVDLMLTDVQGDGHPDLLCLQGGQMHVALGDGTGTLTPGPVFDLSPGSSGFAAGDVDSDGRLDIVSANESSPQPQGVSSYGTLTVLRGLLGTGPSTAAYGAGTHGCGATLGIAANGLPQTGNAAFRILTTNAPPFALGLGLVGNVKDAVGTDYLQLGFAFHIHPFLSTELLAFDLRSDGHGEASFAAPIPNVPSLAGAPYFAQTIWLQPGCPSLPADLSSSRGLEITIVY